MEKYVSQIKILFTPWKYQVLCTASLTWLRVLYSLFQGRNKSHYIVSLSHSFLVLTSPFLQSTRHRHLHVDLITMTIMITVATRKAMTSSK